MFSSADVSHDLLNLSAVQKLFDFLHAKSIPAQGVHFFRVIAKA